MPMPSTLDTISALSRGCVTVLRMVLNTLNPTTPASQPKTPYLRTSDHMMVTRERTVCAANVRKACWTCACQHGQGLRVHEDVVHGVLPGLCLARRVVKDEATAAEEGDDQARPRRPHREVLAHQAREEEEPHAGSPEAQVAQRRKRLWREGVRCVEIVEVAVAVSGELGVVGQREVL